MPDASNLELQFYFADDSLTMDAIVRNENEKELLALLKAIISTFGFSITIESGAFLQGEFKQYWILVGERASEINAILTLTSLFICAKPKKESAAERAAKTEVVEKLVGVQKRKTPLDKAKKELHENEKLHPDTFKEVITILEGNPRLIWYRSNFYKKINLYPRIERVSIALLHEGHVLVGSEKIVVRKNFSAFIISSNELPHNVDEDAIVEIVAPVLTTAKSKWKGIYKGSSITFDIKDEEFKKSVFSKRIEFKNGVAIKCVLQLIQRIDGRGIIKTKSITVLKVFGIINPDSSMISIPIIINTAPLVPENTIAAAVVQEPASPAVEKKTPKVDTRQLDMFA